MTAQASPLYEIDPEGCYLFVGKATRKEILDLALHLIESRMRRSETLLDPGLRRGPQDCATGHPSPLAPSGSRRVIPFAATVLRSLALLRYRSRASSHNDLTPLQGYRGLLASVFDLPWLVERRKALSLGSVGRFRTGNVLPRFPRQPPLGHSL
jgi:hypothetical protein